jgi:hypothetical protein
MPNVGVAGIFAWTRFAAQRDDFGVTLEAWNKGVYIQIAEQFAKYDVLCGRDVLIAKKITP